MLVLARRQDESLIIGDDIKINVLNIDKSQVKLGIEAPANMNVKRE